MLPILPALAVVAAVAFPRAQDEAPPVGVELLADVSGVRPGATFHVVVRFELPEHWHVYWRNPGDSGLATRVELSAPEGFEVGALRFPGPDRFTVAGDLEVYGYAGRPALFVPVTAPQELAPREVSFTARVRWLVCKEACFLGEAERELELPVGPTAERAHSDVLAPWRARLPRPWSELEDAQVRWSGAPDAPRLEIEVRGTDELFFFPYEDAPLTLERQAQAMQRLRVDLAPRYGDDSPELAAHGLLRVRRGDSIVFYDARLPRS